MKEDNDKIIEDENVKEENNIVKDAMPNFKKCQKGNNTLKSFFCSKVFLSILSFSVGIILMYFLINVGVNNITKETKRKITSTTVEEISDLKSAINNVYESTVYIEVSGERGFSSSGSGFVYKSDDNYGYILTNYHVIEGGTKFVVTFTDGSEAETTLVNGDEYYDIAILKVPVNNLKLVAKIGNSSSIELGDTVFTVGAPLGKDYMGTITKGIVSGVNRMVSVKLMSGSYLMEVIQTDASINSGNSGGPICNIKGEVIGITSSKLVGSGVEGMGFAIPINSVMSIIDFVESGNKIERPYLGIQLVDLTNTFALQYYYGITIDKDVTFGAVLSYVEDGKSASKAGLKVGDIIVKINDDKVEDSSHFKYLLYKHAIGEKITIKYYRDNKLQDATIELTESIEQK